MTQSKDPEQNVVIGFAWYRPEQWERVRDISTDADVLEDTYEEWLGLAEQKAAELEAAGVRVEKVDVHSEELVRWCNEKNMEVNAKARSQFAVEKLRERHAADLT